MGRHPVARGQLLPARFFQPLRVSPHRPPWHPPPQKARIPAAQRRGIPPWHHAARDIDAELRALQDKARQLRTRQKAQLGELLLATGAADALDPDALAGLLLHGLEQAKANP